MYMYSERSRPLHDPIESGNRMHSLVLVISPLISLMVDQVLSLRSRGVSAAIMSSGSSVEKDLIANSTDLTFYNLLFLVPD